LHIPHLHAIIAGLVALIVAVAVFAVTRTEAAPLEDGSLPSDIPTVSTEDDTAPAMPGAEAENETTAPEAEVTTEAPTTGTEGHHNLMTAGG
jgi:hypothetical protein